MKIKATILVFWSMLLFSATMYGQTLNYKIAAVYVYNFTKYIEWPSSIKSSEFVIGVYGPSPITDELKKFLAGKHVGDKIITIEKVQTMDEAAACQILFIPFAETDNLKKISGQLKGKPVLIVCEKEGLSRRGASITIYIDDDDDDKTKFELNEEYIKANGLFVSQRLIDMASK